jgi:hypothetical protein
VLHDCCILIEAHAKQLLFTKSLLCATKRLTRSVQISIFCMNGTVYIVRYANFGDLGTAVKSLMDEYQRLSKLNENIQSIEDMQVSAG